ncbi:condensation domain-containing protein [Micromonospora sp. SH-82]|uniref:condensation domain-containing protein n=1 Tax=Micromonospora sp. SH-82 TaxID=3132938 RepID=UPI003EBACC05
MDAVVPDEWASRPVVRAEFRGEGPLTAPLTWGQQVMWRANALSGSNHRFMNLRRALPVSDRVDADLATATRAVGALVARHASLRTRVQPYRDGLIQEAAAVGVLPLLVVAGEGDGSAQATATADLFGDVAFDHAEEWPVRAAVVLVDDRVRQIVLVFSHSTVDAHAVDVVLRDLRLLLVRGAIAVPAGAQSVQVGLRQQGPDRLRSARAVAYWLREFPRVHPLDLPTVGPGLEPRLPRGVLVSSALERAVRLVAARHRVTTSTALLTAMTALTVRGRDPGPCGFFPMSHNRFRPDFTQTVANIGQIGFGVVDLTGRPSFGELSSRVWKASLSAYRNAYYDTADLRRGFTDLGYEYGTVFLPYHYFNDVRLPGGEGGPLPTVSEAQLRAETAHSTYGWTAGLDVASWHLLAHVVDEPGALGVTLSADSRFVARDTVHQFLRDLEELMVRAAFADVPWPWRPTSDPVGPTPDPVAPVPPRPTPDADQLRYAPFAGGMDRTGPLTWGQRAMWRAVVEFESTERSVLNLRRTLPLSPRAGVDVDRAVAALGSLVGRHESLRTRVRVGDGDLCQVASARGDLPVTVRTAEPGTDPDGRAAARTLAADLGDPPFDHAAGWPLRAALVVVDGLVRQVVVVFSHSTVDFHAAELVLRDLRITLLRGAPATTPALQSLDVALRESGTAQRRSRRAVAHWMRQFRRLPEGMFETVEPGEEPRYRRGSLVSTVIDPAVRAIAARHGVTTATVLLAATAAVVTASTRREVCGLFAMSNNRFLPEYAPAVSKLNQLGICLIDLADRPDFAGVLARTRAASLEAYRHAYYDPRDLAQAFTDLGYDYGTALAPFCYFNDIRIPTGVPETGGSGVGDAEGPGPDPTALRAARSGSVFTWSESLERFAWRCRLQVVDAPGAVELVVTADTRHLSAHRAEGLVRAVEGLLVEAAVGDVPWPWCPPDDPGTDRKIPFPTAVRP